MNACATHAKTLTKVAARLVKTVKKDLGIQLVPELIAFGHLI